MNSISSFLTVPTLAKELVQNTVEQTMKSTIGETSPAVSLGNTAIAGLLGNRTSNSSQKCGEGVLERALSVVEEFLNIVSQLIQVFTGQSANPQSSVTGGQGASLTQNSPTSGEISNDFLWKPKSEKDGKLAILLPAEMTGQVEGVRVLSPDGQAILARGKYANIGNGGREHYRFTKPGSSFPPGSHVEILLKDDTRKTITIMQPNQRTVE